MRREEHFCKEHGVRSFELPPTWGVLCPNRDGEFEPYVTRDFPATKEPVRCPDCDGAVFVRWVEEEDPHPTPAAA
jgi:hypothetical protein